MYRAFDGATVENAIAQLCCTVRTNIAGGIDLDIDAAERDLPAFRFWPRRFGHDAANKWLRGVFTMLFRE
jgi:hypothetical protein